jgi:hypothetical protein
MSSKFILKKHKLEKKIIHIKNWGTKMMDLEVEGPKA